MSKKNKRQLRRSAVQQTPDTVSSVVENDRILGNSSVSQSFNPDYSYVKKDLRRIGILAGVFLSLLVILSFFLR
jgi:hypothetical protein